MRRVVVSGSVQGGTLNFRRVKIDKVKKLCNECGGNVVPDKPFGAIYIPKKIALPEEIVITLKERKEE